MMNKLDPEMAKMVMEKVMERVREGNVKAIAIKFGEGEEEMPMGEDSEGSGEMCSKCGCSCEDTDNYCRECGNDLNKNPDKDVEGKGDVDTKAVAKQEYGDKEQEMRDLEEEKDYLERKNVERLKEFAKKK